MSFMDKNALLRRATQPNTTLTAGETKRLFQILLEEINDLKARYEGLCGSGSTESAEAKDQAPGTGRRGRPRKSDAEGADEEGSA